MPETIGGTLLAIAMVIILLAIVWVEGYRTAMQEFSKEDIYHDQS